MNQEKEQDDLKIRKAKKIVLARAAIEAAMLFKMLVSEETGTPLGRLSTDRSISNFFKSEGYMTCTVENDIVDQINNGELSYEKFI